MGALPYFVRVSFFLYNKKVVYNKLLYVPIYGSESADVRVYLPVTSGIELW